MARSSPMMRKGVAMPDIIHTMDKLSGLAALLYTEDQRPRTFETDDLNGVSEILRGIAGDLFQISEEHAKALVQKNDRERRLEQFMGDVANLMDEEPNDWNFKAVAINIRKQLNR